MPPTPPTQPPDLSNMAQNLSKRERAARILGSWEMLSWFATNNGEVQPLHRAPFSSFSPPPLRANFIDFQ